MNLDETDFQSDTSVEKFRILILIYLKFSTSPNFKRKTKMLKRKKLKKAGGIDSGYEC